MAIGNFVATDRAANTFDNVESSAAARSPLTTDIPRKASSFAIATSGTFTDNGSSNFAGDLSNPFDDAQLYANGVTINGIPTFSGFGAAIAVGPGAVVPDAVRQRWTVENLSQAVAIDVPAYVVPTLPGSDYIVDVRSLSLNNAADVVRVFGDGGLPSIVYFTGGSLALPDQVNLKNVTIVVESGDLNFNGDRHLLENVTIVVKDGSVNLGDVRAVNSSVYSAGAIHMNQGARFSGKNFLGTKNGDVIFNGATETIDPKDFVKVVAHGDIFLNSGADVRGEFWSSEDFFANRATTIFGSVRAQQSITFNAQVRVISDILQNTNFPLKNQPAIAIIDTGFAGNNPAIDYSRIIPLSDRVGGDDNPFLPDDDVDRHGTDTLNLIAATQNNDLGIYGANGSAPIYVSRAVGSGQWAQAVVEFLNRYKADGKQPNPIIHLGFDLTQRNADGSITTRYELTVEERAALEYARQNGALIVVPAGNDGDIMSILGQAAQEFDNIVTVGAVDATGRAPYSSYGQGLMVMAPGDLGTMAGTSAAAAIATGQIANIWAANPELSYQQIIDIIRATARDINQPGWDEETGIGILDMTAGIDLAQQMQPEPYDPPATILPDSWSGQGLVEPLERAAAFNYPIRNESFEGSVRPIGAPYYGVAYRKSPVWDDRWGPGIDQGIAAGSGRRLDFDAWTYGEASIDSLTGRLDALWYRVKGTNYWVPSSLISNYPGSNPPVMPDGSTPGPGESNRPPSAQPGQRREYRVRRGDTLSRIAQQELGNANRWPEIQKANGSNFTEAEARQLQIGTSVYLPVVYKTPTSNNDPVKLPRTGSPVIPSQLDSLEKAVSNTKSTVKTLQETIRDLDRSIAEHEKDNNEYLRPGLQESKRRISEIKSNPFWWFFPGNHGELKRLETDIAITEAQIKINDEWIQKTREDVDNKTRLLDRSSEQLRQKQIELNQFKQLYGTYINLASRAQDENWWENEINDGSDLEEINNNSDPNGLGSIYRDLSTDLFGKGKYFRMSGAYISDEYRDQTGKIFGYHGAIDIAAPSDTEVMAIVAGKIVYRNDELGMLTIRDARGFNHIYVHLNSIDLNLKVDVDVKRGQPVGRTGNKATSSPHLHYEVAEKDFIMGALQTGQGLTLSKQDFRDRTRNPLKDYWEMKWNGMI
jgi:murein DD-endopeptidase MepM/ murein hydrolase activator NlpD